MLTEDLTAEIERLGDKRWKGHHRQYHPRHLRVEPSRAARIGLLVGLPAIAAAILVPMAHGSTQDAPVWVAAEMAATSPAPPVMAGQPFWESLPKPEYTARHAVKPRAKSHVYVSASYGQTLPVSKPKPVEPETVTEELPPKQTSPEPPKETDGEPENQQEPPEACDEHACEGESPPVVAPGQGTEGTPPEGAGEAAPEQPPVDLGGETDPLAGVESEGQAA